MFRKLARIKQQLPQAECIDILKAEPRGVLSVLGDDGYPYGMPLNHYYCEADGKIYFHSGKTGHKVDAIMREPKVSFCVCDQGVREDGDWALTFRSVIVFGKIEIVEDYDRIIEISRALSHKFTQDEAYIADEVEKHGKHTLCFALVPEQICGKRVHEK
ncbi:MAG: pyridoxamine 5'-phosphate oxidase family protein [Oscillospiraceae bacterium]|nr:pyridoxamine 5'-phosphate oxidase family protein [Oscillospiraceae bacterium]